LDASRRLEAPSDSFAAIGGGPVTAAFARGACPTVAEPMATGDGLLARLPPALAPLTPAMLTGLCAAADTHGNGIVEITQRGSIQVRGLTAELVAGFGVALAAAGIAVGDGVPIVTSAIAGLDPSEACDIRSLAAELSEALASVGLAAALAPKISVLLDGGGRLHLDALAADVRLAAEPGQGGVRYRLAAAGTAADATDLGGVARGDIVPAIVALLRRIAGYGPRARARDLLKAEGAASVRAKLGVVLTDLPPQPPRSPAEPVGIHPLGDGRVAFGIGLAFGHARAFALKAFVNEAVAIGADGLAPAGRRVLLAVGVPASRAPALLTTAERLGFVARSDDPRRFLAACAGAPDCPSGRMAARRVAPELARILAPVLDGSIDVHLSGCAKGCAHPGPAALTLVGGDAGCGVILAGRAGDASRGSLSPRDLPQALASFVATLTARRRAGETSADLLRRLGDDTVASLLLGETVDG
jgi:precorrin-3B synthase